jgi:hypothetical protein
MTNDVTPTNDDLTAEDINLVDRDGLGELGAALAGFPETVQAFQNLLLTTMILGKALGVPDSDIERLTVQNIDIAKQILGRMGDEGIPND